MITTDLTYPNRLLAIAWEANGDRLDSHMALFQEYRRQIALWANTLDRTELWPLFNIAEILEPSIHAAISV